MTPVHDDACGTATSGTSTGDAAVRRTVESGQGWIAGGGPPEGAAPLVDRISAAWRDAGREGEPRFAALAYFGLGDEAASGAALRSYYGFAGDYAEAIAASALRTPQGVKDALRAFRDVGITEIVFVPTVASLDEVDRLADTVFAA